MAWFEVSKPVNNDGLLIPAYFRELFGCTWDICYGLAVILSIILVNWCNLDENYYLLILSIHIDIYIIFDISISMFIRFFQTVQVIAVNRNIEAVFIASRNVMGLWLDFTSCIPFLPLMLLTAPRSFYVNAYTIICLLRMGRLFTPRRMTLDQNAREKMYRTEFSAETRHKETSSLSLKDFELQRNGTMHFAIKRRGKRKIL